MSGNRKKVNNYLNKFYSLKVNYTPEDEIENFIGTFSNVLNPEQITPLEYVIVECLNEPKKIETICVEINAPTKVVKNALNRLFGKGICTMVRDNKIDIRWRKKDLFEHGLIKPMFPLGNN